MRGNVWGPRQRITVEEPQRVGTLRGAYASIEERLKGSIQAGKLADLVVLGRDPLREPAESLLTIPVEKTMAGDAGCMKPERGRPRRLTLQAECLHNGGKLEE